jgi:hypothetical protein
MASNRLKGILGRRDATSEEIREAIELAVREAVRRHKRAGNSIVVWDRENDRAVVLPPEQIDIPEDDEQRN